MVVANIYLLTDGFNCHGGIVISGGDSSRRHLVSPLSIRLHTFLLILSNLNQKYLLKNVLFNIEKKFIQPQFHFQKKSIN